MTNETVFQVSGPDDAVVSLVLAVGRMDVKLVYQGTEWHTSLTYERGVVVENGHDGQQVGRAPGRPRRPRGPMTVAQATGADGTK